MIIQLIKISNKKIKETTKNIHVPDVYEVWLSLLENYILK